MANELKAVFPIAGTLYSVLDRQSDGKVWNGTTYITASTDDRSVSPVAMTRQGTTWVYYGDLPAGVGTTPCNYTVYLQAGGSPAVTDAPVGVGVTVDVASIAPGVITDTAIAFPAEAAGRPTTFLAVMRRAWEWAVNLRKRNRTTGVVTLYGADNTTVLETQTQSTAVVTGNMIDSQTKGV